VGEFLRCHHARLAHEIGPGRVPGPGKEFLKLAEELDPWQKDLASMALLPSGRGLPNKAMIFIEVPFPEIYSY
jgi:hypothetical protein